MKKIFIVESPGKIKTIKKFLGNDFTIMSTIGHIKDLPANKLGVTVNGAVDIEYVTIPGKEKVIADICKASVNADEVYLAADPDREGEIIAWHIGNEIKKVMKKAKNIHRITYNEITKTAIINALKNPAEVDMDKVNAQQARRVLDRWVGYEVSPILWKKLAPGLSAGRVQSVALRLICDRELEIRGFKPEEYWSITGTFANSPKSKFNAELTHIGKEKAEIKDEKTATEAVNAIKKASFTIDSITDKKRLRNPTPPFMTSSLQQAAFNQLGFPVKKTMQLAQKLYEGIELEDRNTPVALITYMRTDSKRIAESALQQVRTFIHENYTDEYLPKSPNIYTKEADKGQDAHEAIRPIDVTITPDYVHKYAEKDVARLYELIWQCFVACQMKPAEYAQRQVVIIGDKFTFKVTGSTLVFDGFLKAYSLEDDDGDSDKEGKVVLPADLEAKKPAALKAIDPKQHFTQPPPKYSEASLIKTLEKEGIGRPSTYNAILNTIQARQYTTVDKKKRISPTELGMAVTKMLVENLPDIMDSKFTAAMEEGLDKIAHGEIKRDKVLKEFYKNFQAEVEKFMGTGEKGKRLEPTEIDCPTCKKHKLAIRFGKTGEFLGCMGYPECTFTANFKRNEQGVIEIVKAEAPEMLDKKCPDCSKQLRRMVGKYGAFIACSGYPDCSYIERKKADIPCPLCKGDLVERKWRGGTFWGCANYPKCKFALFGDIEKTPCPVCGLPVLARKEGKNGEIILSCTSKECGYRSS